MNVIRFLDVLIAFFGLLFGAPILLLIAALTLFDTGSSVFIQVRVGRNQKPFKLVKFRSMHIGTEDIATHLVNRDAITPIGRVLRRSRLDELPQLWNVLSGDMSLVGPRPCLPNQIELVAERARMDVFNVRPGLTGLAQISGVDMSNPKKLVSLEVEMLHDMSVVNYFKYIWYTVIGKRLGV
jgi:lipopolysaccharide/colanic/teichoic acid biosynthesis glycosyltransferase